MDSTFIRQGQHTWREQAATTEQCKQQESEDVNPPFQPWLHPTIGGQHVSDTQSGMVIVDNIEGCRYHPLSTHSLWPLHQCKKFPLLLVEEGTGRL
jgi:hypothetical protein